jgi:hypothetical protein
MPSWNGYIHQYAEILNFKAWDTETDYQAGYVRFHSLSWFGSRCLNFNTQVVFHNIGGFRFLKRSL